MLLTSLCLANEGSAVGLEAYSVGINEPWH